MSNNTVNGPADGPRKIFGKINRNYAGARKATEVSAPSSASAAASDFATNQDIHELASEHIEQDAQYARYEAHHNIADAVRDHPDWMHSERMFKTVNTALAQEHSGEVINDQGRIELPVNDALKEHFGKNNYNGIRRIYYKEDGKDMQVMEIAQLVADQYMQQGDIDATAEKFDEYLQAVATHVEASGGKSFTYEIKTNNVQSPMTASLYCNVDTPGVYKTKYASYEESQPKTMYDILEDFHDHFNG